MIARDTERDNYMTAEEAAAYGLIDRVITRTLGPVINLELRCEHASKT